ncbi:hypothetical protein Cantr_07334 [Candida viswanathii]|uniref:Peptide hydrolase n=1 Tax=Candida viswanathii TaxID=5486 RepID=A0A367Y2B4_9ASCO|nr:hypothetical protein Cantr_07334 [Candida viswanathii]
MPHLTNGQVAILGPLDGEFIFGRGAADCKNVLIAILETLELLLSKGFQPERTSLLLWVDEEASGVHGASSISKYLQETYGPKSIYALIDEGPGLNLDPWTDTIIATVLLAFLRAGYDKFANSILIRKLLESKLTKYLIRTSQAIDTIVGVAKRHNLSVVAYGEEVLTLDADSGLFSVTVNSPPLNAAPVTPSNDTVWAYLAGVTRHVFEDLVYPDITYPIVTAPGIMTPNTDTRHYGT